MHVRRFLLENEKGQQFRMDNLDEGCFLTSPSGLGYSYNVNFVQLGYDFIENNRKINQQILKGTAYFKSYNMVKNFIDYVESAKNLKWIYKIPFENEEKIFYRDVVITKLDKTEKSGRWLAGPIEFASKSLWYEQNETIFKIRPQINETRWNFNWNTVFNDNSSQSINYENKSHTDAPITLEIDGPVSNPNFEIYVNGELIQEVKIKVNILKYEKLIYNSKENEFSIAKIKTDGTKESLFDLDIIDFKNNNVICIPQNKICELRIRADNTIENAKLTIYPQYKCV